MRASVHLTVLALILSSIFIPIVMTNVRAAECYDATVRVVDRENRPISGVNLMITFANATNRGFTTDNQGEVYLGCIPVGTYNVQVNYQNRDMGTWSLDASVGPVDTIKLDVGEVTSGPVISSLVLLTIFGLGLFMLLLALKVRKPPRPPVV